MKSDVISQRTPYIDLTARTKPILESLERAATRQQICTLMGPRGSGKSALVDHWHRTRITRDAAHPRTIMVHLRPAQHIPMACVLYSRLWHELLRLQQPAYVPERYAIDTAIKMYTGRQLHSLHSQVIRELERLHIQAIVIDNADLLDQTALEWSLDLRTYFHPVHGYIPRRGIILVGKSSADTIRNNKLIRMLAANDEIYEGWTEQCELHTLRSDEIAHVLLTILVDHLQVSFAPDVRLQREAEELSTLLQGNWHYVARLYTILDEELGTSTHPATRQMTNKVFARAKNRFYHTSL